MTRAVIASVLMALLIGGAVMLVARDKRPSNASETATTETLDLTSSETCRECHQEVYDEWKSSQHAFAFVNPLVRREDMTDGFRKKDCVPCHAPRPVFEHGLGKAARVLARDTNRVFGVDCLSCHQVADGVAATRPGLSGACKPIFRPELRSTDLCAPCHNQHFTVDEWEQSPPELRGENCSHCHMPPVQRPATANRPAYTGSFHGSRGGQDLELLRKSATVTCNVVDSNRLEVSVTNSGTAHNLPTDARHRAVDLVIHLRDESGETVGTSIQLGAGENGGNARLRFRNPYRDEYGKVDTQIPSGETRTLEVVFDPEEAASAEVLLLYKRTPFVPDEEATVVHRQTVSF